MNWPDNPVKTRNPGLGPGWPSNRVWKLCLKQIFLCSSLTNATWLNSFFFLFLLTWMSESACTNFEINDHVSLQWPQENLNSWSRNKLKTWPLKMLPHDGLVPFMLWKPAYSKGKVIYFSNNIYVIYSVIYDRFWSLSFEVESTLLTFLRGLMTI
jgi:hypothetical protein